MSIMQSHHAWHFSSDSKTYRYKGWKYQQAARGKWIMKRESDDFWSDHHSKTGCEAFIRLFGQAENPDRAYAEAI